MLFLGLLESCDKTASRDNAFSRICAYCVIGFMFYSLFFLPRRLFLRQREKKRHLHNMQW